MTVEEYQRYRFYSDEVEMMSQGELAFRQFVHYRMRKFVKMLDWSLGPRIGLRNAWTKFL